MKGIGVVIHGITGRMGDMARRSLQQIAEAGGISVEGESRLPVPIGLGRDLEKVRRYCAANRVEHACDDLEEAIGRAAEIDPDHQVYHCCVSTGAKTGVLLEALEKLDSATTAVFQEKPLAGNYAEGREVVEVLERRRFYHGVVHDFLEAPGIRQAVRMMPAIRPLTAHMIFGYETGAGFSGNPEFHGQRPDFNWTLKAAGGGIILDMSHESYISRALFGATESLSCVSALLVPRRRSAAGEAVIECDVEDFAVLRRAHPGVVNTSSWSWFRRINSEFGPLEISVEGEGGSVVCGLYGLKVQWSEMAPAVRWKDSLEGKKVEWRDHWQYLDLPARNPFAVEFERFIGAFLRGEAYALDAVAALDILGEVEALYESAARAGAVVPASRFLRYPDRVPPGWRPERLQGLYGRRGS